MEINEYQETVKNYIDYPTELGPYYLILDMMGDVGKLSDKIKNTIKDEATMAKEDKILINISLGDLMYHISLIASSLGVSLEEILALNLRKLSLQKEKDVKEKTSIKK